MGKKILTIEDHRDTRELLARILRYKGYEPLEAKGGYEGIAISLAEHPDLVLMDLILPDLHGLDAAKQIKANPETAQIPIVAYTAWYQRDMRAKALEAGIAEYLVKPVPTEALIEVIERLTAIPVRH
jgi:two-component system, cell cycle response regulator DivK